jgi:hypothetical protein
MAVTQTRARRDTITLTGPLDDAFAAAQNIVNDYLGRGYILQNTSTDLTGPRLVLVFGKDND